jgi:chorismate mutase
MEKPITPQSLKEIRSEIDAVDRAMLELLERRFAAIRLIKQWKEQRGEEAISPIRPAREAEILRRLERLRGDAVPAELMVRLWRAMMAAATAAQAKVTIHMSGVIGGDGALRDLVREHFTGLALEEHGSIEDTIRATAQKPADVGVVEPQSDWIVPVLQERQLKVIGMLPVLSHVRMPPKLLLLGQAKAEPTGEDQTLIALAAGTEAPSAALWSATAGDFRCVAFAGFLDETSAIVKKAGRAIILGHCPSPLEARR